MKFLLLFVCFCNVLHAQDFNSGKVSETELQKTNHPFYKDAVACKRYEEGNLSMRYEERWLYEFKVNKRIEIYTKEGFVLDYFPEPKTTNILIDAGAYGFKINNLSADSPEIAVIKTIKSYKLSSDYYNPIKEFYKNIVNLETNKVIIKRL